MPLSSNRKRQQHRVGVRREPADGEVRRAEQHREADAVGDHVGRQVRVVREPDVGERDQGEDQPEDDERELGAPAGYRERRRRMTSAMAVRSGGSASASGSARVTAKEAGVVPRGAAWPSVSAGVGQASARNRATMPARPSTARVDAVVQVRLLEVGQRVDGDVGALVDRGQVDAERPSRSRRGRSSTLAVDFGADEVLRAGVEERADDAGDDDDETSTDDPGQPAAAAVSSSTSSSGDRCRAVGFARPRPTFAARAAGVSSSAAVASALRRLRRPHRRRSGSLVGRCRPRRRRRRSR